MQDMCSGWLILHKVNTSLVLCRTSHHLYNRTPASAKRVCRMLLLMPGLALHTAQSSFDSIVPRPVPASIADHVLFRVLSLAACSHAGIGSGGGAGMPSGPLSQPASLKAAGLTTRHIREQQAWLHVITALHIVGCWLFLDRQARWQSCSPHSTPQSHAFTGKLTL